jgi:hypothetical protein
MPSWRSLLFPVIALMIAGLFAALPGAAVAANEPKVTMAKHRDGPYQDTYPRVNLAGGEVTNLYLKVRNRAHPRQTLTMTDDSYDPGGDYRRTWFDGDKEVTNRVEGSGYELKLKHDESERFRLHVKAKPSPDPGCLGPRFHAQPSDTYSWGYFALNDDPGAICSG